MAEKKRINHCDYVRKLVALPDGEHKLRLSALENNLNGLVMDVQRLVGIIGRINEIEPIETSQNEVEGEPARRIDPSGTTYLLQMLNDSLADIKETREYWQLIFDDAFEEHSREGSGIVTPREAGIVAGSIFDPKKTH